MAIGARRFARKKGGSKNNPLYKLCSALFATSAVPIDNTVTGSEVSFWCAVLYFWVGSAMLTSGVGVETMSTVDSVYFLTVTMTTVGYGDVTPQTTKGKVFVMVWAIFGVSVIAAFLVEVASGVLDARDALIQSTRAAMLRSANSSGGGEDMEGGDEEDQLFKEGETLPGPAKKKAKKKAPVEKKQPAPPPKPKPKPKPPPPPPPPPPQPPFDSSPQKPGRHSSSSSELVPGRTKRRSSELLMSELMMLRPKVRGWDRVKALFPVLELVAMLVAYAAAVGLAFGALEEGWTFIDGFYFAVITGTTVGYGDVSPQTPAGRLLAVFYIPCAVVFVGTCVGQVGDRIFGAEEASERLERMLGANLSMTRILEMDKDGDGSLTEFEYIKFMLTQADACGADVLDSLHARFQALDEDGSGVLDANDLKKEPLGANCGHAAGASVTGAQQGWTRAVKCMPAPHKIMVRMALQQQLHPPKKGLPSADLLAVGAHMRKQRYRELQLEKMFGHKLTKAQSLDLRTPATGSPAHSPRHRDAKGKPLPFGGRAGGGGGGALAGEDELRERRPGGDLTPRVVARTSASKGGVAAAVARPPQPRKASPRASGKLEVDPTLAVRASAAGSPEAGERPGGEGGGAKGEGMEIVRPPKHNSFGQVSSSRGSSKSASSKAGSPYSASSSTTPRGGKPGAKPGASGQLGLRPASSASVGRGSKADVAGGGRLPRPRSADNVTAAGSSNRGSPASSVGTVVTHASSKGAARGGGGTRSTRASFESGAGGHHRASRESLEFAGEVGKEYPSAPAPMPRPAPRPAGSSRTPTSKAL